MRCLTSACADQQLCAHKHVCRSHEKVSACWPFQSRCLAIHLADLRCLSVSCMRSTGEVVCSGKLSVAATPSSSAAAGLVHLRLNWFMLSIDAWRPLAVSMAGFLAGTALSCAWSTWCAGCNNAHSVSHCLSRHAVLPGTCHGPVLQRHQLQAWPSPSGQLPNPCCQWHHGHSQVLQRGRCASVPQR